MFSLTVKEAARELGVSPGRVYQLVASGALAAERIGRMLLVDDRSVRERQALRPSPGRPRAQKAQLSRYTLMSRDHEVASFSYDERRHRFADVGPVIDAARAPLGLVSPRGRKMAAAALSDWWEHRSIPATRSGIQQKLLELGLEAPWDIPFQSLGLSLSDQFWVRPEGADVRWEDVNFFDHPSLPELKDATWLGDVGLSSPDNTSEGELPKAWVSLDGMPFLAKGGEGLGQQPMNELAATRLYERVLEPREYVRYRLAQSPQGLVSLCADFVSREEEYIPAWYVRSIARQPNHRSDYQHYLECCAMLGVEDAEASLAKMLVLDDVIGNTDRHWRNFGLVRNVETLECRPAPLFDAGASLWCEADLQALASGSCAFATKPFFRDPNRQLRLVNDYSWLDLGALDGFPEEVEQILSASAALAPRAPWVRQAVESRIARLRVLI